MNFLERDFQIQRLSDAFYAAYPDPPYNEILKKRTRVYNCILIQTSYDYFICVPYRTEISHAYAYHFKNSKRSKLHHSGLDYTKIVIIKNLNYINSEPVVIDQDEYKETVRNIEKIKREALAFVEDYTAHIEGKKMLHPREFQRRYSFSPLKYFHQELGLAPTHFSTLTNQNK